jgi:hypothetical protein
MTVSDLSKFTRPKCPIFQNANRLLKIMSRTFLHQVVGFFGFSIAEPANAFDAGRDIFSNHLMLFEVVGAPQCLFRPRGGNLHIGSANY